MVRTTSARLLALLSLLQIRREWTGQELAGRLEVGQRTIRRDVEKLRSLGYPIEAAPGVAGIEETSVSALAKLEQVLPARLRRRVRALGDAMSAFPVGGPGIDAEVLATLAGACRDRVRLRFGYVARDGEDACVVPAGPGRWRTSSTWRCSTCRWRCSPHRSSWRRRARLGRG